MITPALGQAQNPAYQTYVKEHILFHNLRKPAKISAMKRSEILFGLLKIPTDFVMAVLAFLAAYKLRLLTEPIPGVAKPIDYSVLPTIKEYLDFSIYTAIALLAVFAIGKMYSLKSTVLFSKEIRKAFLLGIIWVMLMVTYFFFTRTFPFSRLAMIYSWGIAILFIILGRAIIRILQKIALSSGIGRRRVLFIGNNAIAHELIEKFKKNKSYKIIGIVGTEQKESPKGIKLLGNITQLEKLAKRHEINEIIQTHSDLSETRSKDILEFCEEHHIEYSFVPDQMEVQRTNVVVQTIGAIPLITLRKTPLDGWGKVTKRIMDIVGAILGLILLSPLLLATAIAIKFDSQGPVLFTKLDDGTPVKRVGQHGKLFRFYKFRSMHPKTHNLRYTELSSKNYRKDSPLVKIKDDPRITRVGRFIRKYSIDELPQLWNVILGNVSLVGPRPHLPEEVARYKRHHKFVLTIKPGLTGLPQTSGRSDLDFETEIRLDRYYIENWSMWLDTKLVFKTIGILLKGYKE
jgi:exopolysaccharide biosynthesis polyprenyl glycosylphosphotransferase